MQYINMNKRGLVSFVSFSPIPKYESKSLNSKISSQNGSNLRVTTNYTHQSIMMVRTMGKRVV